MAGANAFKKVAVLMGGPSAEREVSLKSGRAVADGLREAGYEVSEIDIPDRELDIPRGIDAVFIALHGEFGEDGEVQALLDAQGVPYTGAGAASSQMSFSKILSKRVFDDNGIPTPAYEALKKPEGRSLPLPVVTKPSRQGSTIGIHRVFSEDQWQAAAVDTLTYDSDMIVEAFIDGPELTVGIVDDQILPAIEIRAPDGWYDYEAKYTKGKTEYLVPAPIDDAMALACRETARQTFEALGCRGFARVDIMADRDQRLYVLELNTIPGFTETSLLPKAAAQAGISFSELCARIMGTATTG